MTSLSPAAIRCALVTSAAAAAAYQTVTHINVTKPFHVNEDNATMSIEIQQCTVDDQLSHFALLVLLKIH